MSWSVGAYGKVEAVRKEIAEQFKRPAYCKDPEEKIRQGAAELIDTVLADQRPGSVIRVTASGSQDINYETKQTRNSLSISIAPEWQFLE